MTETLIEGLDFFKGLKSHQLDKISSFSSIREYAKDASVQQEKDEADAMYFVKQGRVLLQIQMPQNRKIDIDTIMPGECFGWSALVPPHHITATSICLEDSVLIVIPRTPLMQLMQEDVEVKSCIYESISRTIGHRLKETRMQLIYLLEWS